MTLSYGALVERVRLLAATLPVPEHDPSRAPGAENTPVVSVELPKSAAWLVAVLATWWAGAAWTPIDPELPDTRKDLLRRLCRVRHRLGSEPSPPVFSPTRPARLALAEDLAYVICTSGSTGQPRPVGVCHRGLPYVLGAQIPAFDLHPGDRALLYLSTSFDASISDLGTTLLAGATLVIDPEAAHDLPGVLQKRRITHADLPPAVLRSLPPEVLPDCLRVLVVGGEPSEPAVLRAHAKKRRVVAVYGPTEATICSHLVQVHPTRWTRPYLGRPIPGVTQQIRLEEGGRSGELLLGGPTLATYLDDGPDRRVHGLYATGDRVSAGRYGPIFLGRVDREISRNGVRIAPEEVEAAIRVSPGIQDVVVIWTGTTLVAVVVQQDPSQKPGIAAEISRALSPQVWATLPATLRPDRALVHPGPLPRTRSGKASLPEIRAWVQAQLQPAALPAGPAPTPPVSEDEARWLRIFRGSLPGQAIGATDTLAELGASSLVMLQIGVRARLEGLPAPRPGDSARSLSGDRPDPIPSPDPSVHPWTPTEAPSRSAPAAPLPGVGPGGRVLITGGAGYFGRWLIAALLRADLRVTALVRACDPLAAQARVGPGVDVVPGDLEDPALCLDDLPRFDAVIHAAAEVRLGLSHALGPADAPSDLRTTRAALRLADNAPFHHISSRIVALLPNEVSAYTRARRAAELEVKTRTSPWWIHRVGLLVHPAMPRGLQLPRVVRGLVALGHLPEGLPDSLAFDLTDVEAAAQAVVAAVLSPPHPGTTLTHPGARSTLGELRDTLGALGHPLTPMPQSRWRQLAAAHPDPDVHVAAGALLGWLPGAQPADQALDLFLLSRADDAAGTAPAPPLAALIRGWLD